MTQSQPGRRLRRAIAVVAAAAALALGTAVLPPAPTDPAAAATTSPIARVVAVGDIARAGGAQSRTAARIAALAPWRVLALGDLAYPDGSASDFSTYYEPAYGRFTSITWPVPGNHEYRTAGAGGYTSYFGISGPTWWARRAGAWLVVGLDSERASSATQLAFLTQTLAANDGRPTAVLWHRPRYSLGEHGDQTGTQPLWSVVSADRDVRLALWGHDHDYERMAVPVSGRPSVQAFVVGTGGAELRPFSTRSRTWSQKRIAGRYGVLELRLRATSFSWYFVRADGVIADTGTRYF